MSLSIEKGHILGLIGPNGSGKTTLLNIVSGLYTADAGRIRLGRSGCIQQRFSSRVGITDDPVFVSRDSRLREIKAAQTRSSAHVKILALAGDHLVIRKLYDSVRVQAFEPDESNILVAIAAEARRTTGPGLRQTGEIFSRCIR